MQHETADDSRPDALARFKAEAWPLLPMLLRVATMLTRDEHRAEDLVQEALMRAYRRIETFQPGTNMKAWLMTILRHTHIDLYRRESRQIAGASLDALAVEPAASTAPKHQDAKAWNEPDDLLDRFDDETVEHALMNLPDAMRWTLLLVDVEQLTLAEAAEVLDVAVGTVKSRASRARALLRDALRPLAEQRGWVTARTGEA
jgi:RNA polymerase sigma-70 factor (ECF subfamily)